MHPKYSKEKRKIAEDALSNKVNVFETIVSERIASQMPMGDLPRSLKMFEMWEEGVGTTSHTLLFSDYYLPYKHRILWCIEQVKNPPIASGKVHELELEISKLRTQLSNVSEQNIRLNRQLVEVSNSHNLAKSELRDAREQLRRCTNIKSLRDSPCVTVIKDE